MIKNQKCGSIIVKKKKLKWQQEKVSLVIGVEKRRKIVKVVLDIETDELNASVVNCIVAKNMDTNVYTVFDPSNMYSFKKSI